MEGGEEEERERRVREGECGRMEGRRRRERGDLERDSVEEWRGGGGEREKSKRGRVWKNGGEEKTERRVREEKC